MFSPKKLVLLSSAHGKGVFAISVIPAGDEVLEFGGPRVLRADLPVPYERVPDRYLQIDKELYLGASGEIDDFVNHSCDPNTGIFFQNGSVGLKSLRRIEPGEEITFDYSTTMDEDEWEMDCACGATACRGRVQDFKKLSAAVRERYLRLGIVPQYIIESVISVES